MGHSHLTEDPSDPRLTHGTDSEPIEQAETYLVLSKEEREKGFIRPVRTSYVHIGPTQLSGDLGIGCNATTTMGRELAETYARDPKFYGSTYCIYCRMHRPVEEFVWYGTNERVGS